jgi:hypothetical protein
MPISIILETDRGRCSMVPLAVLGYCLTQTNFLQPVWEPLQLSMRQRDYAPVDKLQDVVISILAGCRSINNINVRLRPEQALAQAWGRDKFADQSTYSRTLEALSGEHVAQLRQGSLQWLKLHSQLPYHDWSTWLLLDIDATNLPASKKAEGSQRGWVSGKKTVTLGTCCG